MSLPKIQGEIDMKELKDISTMVKCKKCGNYIAKRHFYCPFCREEIG